MRAVVANGFQKNLLDIPAIVKMYRIENVKELEGALERYVEIAEKKMQDNTMSAQEAEKQRIQIENEFKAMLEKIRMLYRK